MKTLILLGVLCASFITSEQQISPPFIPDLSILKFYTLQSNANLSELCKKQSDIYFNSLIASTKTWPKKLLDSSSKFQSGLLSGHLADLGAFDQCLSVNNQEDDIKGKFCYTRVTIPLPKKSIFDRNFVDDIEIDPKLGELIQPFINTRGMYMGGNIILRWSFCVPSGCSANDVKAHLNSYTQPTTPLPISFPNLVNVKESDCHSLDTKPKLNVGDWIVIGIFIVLAYIILISTIYDLYLYYTKKEPKYKIFIAFSWYTNFKSLIKVNKNSDQLPCLNGIRFISILWIIHGHEYINFIAGELVNQTDVFHWMQWEVWSWFTFGSTVSVDTFFVLSGCLLMYGFLKSQAKNAPFNIPLLYVHRYIRLTPAYLAVIIIYLTLLTHMGSGPIWNETIGELHSTCQTYWWAGLLYIQNYVNGNQYCVGQTWYLSVDMQLFILAPIILLAVKKWPKYVPYLFTALMIIFTIIPTIITWVNDLRTRNPNFFKLYYAQPYTRAGPWILGLWLGYIIFNTKNKIIKINKYLVALLWTLTAVVMIFIVFSNYKTNRPGYTMNNEYSAFFNGFHRNVWGFAISWIIFACLHGYGGPVNWFLSLPIFQVLAKLTYSTYLLHMGIQAIRIGNLRINIYFSNLSVLFSFFGTTCITLLLAIIWILTFEYPFAVIDNVLIGSVSNALRKSPDKTAVK